MSDNSAVERKAPPPSGLHQDEGAARPRRKARSGSAKRDRDCVVKFRARKDERAEMQANAASVGLSLGSFLRSLAVAHPRTRSVKRPLPELKPFVQAMGRLGIYASNAHQLLKLANRGELVQVDELAEASKKLDEAADELLKVIRG
jgi:hypothetical protein